MSRRQVTVFSASCTVEVLAQLSRVFISGGKVLEEHARSRTIYLCAEDDLRSFLLRAQDLALDWTALQPSTAVCLWPFPARLALGYSYDYKAFAGAVTFAWVDGEGSLLLARQANTPGEFELELVMQRQQAGGFFACKLSAHGISLSETGASEITDGLLTSAKRWAVGRGPALDWKHVLNFHSSRALPTRTVVENGSA